MKELQCEADLEDMEQEYFKDFDFVNEMVL